MFSSPLCRCKQDVNTWEKTPALVIIPKIVRTFTLFYVWSLSTITDSQCCPKLRRNIRAYLQKDNEAGSPYLAQIHFCLKKTSFFIARNYNLIIPFGTHVLITLTYMYFVNGSRFPRFYYEI